MIISIIVAMDKKRGIGKNNDLLFKIPEDMERFRKITKGHVVVMGRKTFESIGKPLPNRLNIVISRKANKTIKDCSVVNSLERALELAKQYELDKSQEDSGHILELFIIGGGQIYEQAIKKGLVDKLYLTLVEGNYDADTFFPDYSEFKKVIDEEDRESNGYKYKFLTLER